MQTQNVGVESYCATWVVLEHGWVVVYQSALVTHFLLMSTALLLIHKCSRDNESSTLKQFKPHNYEKVVFKQHAYLESADKLWYWRTLLAK